MLRSFASEWAGHREEEQGQAVLAILLMMTRVQRIVLEDWETTLKA